MRTNAALRAQLDEVKAELKALRRSPQAELLTDLERSARRKGQDPQTAVVEEITEHLEHLRELLPFIQSFRDGKIDLDTFAAGPQSMRDGELFDDDDPQNVDLGRRRDELAGQLEAAEHNLAQRDGELQKQLQNFTAVERAHQEVHAVAASESRSLRAEKERRIAAEQRIEQLTRDLERMARKTQTPSGSPALLTDVAWSH